MDTLKRIISNILYRFGIKISFIKKRGEEDFDKYVDEGFPILYKKYCNESMVAWQGMHDAFDAATYISKSNIDGDVVECGVWRGGVTALIKDVI